MRLRWLGLLLACGLVSACGTGSVPSAEPSVDAPSAAPSAAAPSTASPPAGGIVLQPAPADLGCDAMGVPYRSVTFDIDPDAVKHVTAVTEDHITLETFWSPGFVGGSLEEKVVRDPAGVVVANDGAVLQIPEGAWPRLHGYFVCLSVNALYVLLKDPA